MKAKIEKYLLSTEREGMKNLLSWMDTNGFYKAPCSTSHHLAKSQGLAEHSLNVLDICVKAASYFAPEIPEKSIIICSLLHDLGKCGDRGKALYLPNILKNGKPSEAKPYETNKDLFPIDHEVRSVNIAGRFIELTEDEEAAILWHNGLYGNFKYQIQGRETPLYLLLHFADMWASRVLEKENK